VREDWVCLNGPWQFEIDQGDSGFERGLVSRPFEDEILVPFCPESELSGIGNQDFLNAVWYRRTVDVPGAWENKSLLLHFQAVDYDATIWVDDKEVARHRGGFTPFCVEIESPSSGSFELVVRARDPHDKPMPRGKQTPFFHGIAAVYGRTTGIWQSVWMEPVCRTRLERPRITPDVTGGRFFIEQSLRRGHPGLVLSAKVTSDGKNVGHAEITTGYDFSPTLVLDLAEEDCRLWSPQDPHLYDIEIVLKDGKEVLDRVLSYGGLRSVSLHNKAVLINGEPVFQRLVLDQGYYPDGIMTAPSDAAMIQDIKLSLAAGFNGARLHQKVFEERFLTHADRLGYLVWGEFADWGCSGYGPIGGEHQMPGPDYITQWLEAVERDYSHPSIIGWCPLNETFQGISDQITQLDDVTRGMFLATKAIDATRPVLDTSGYSHRVVESDIYDSHDYTQDVADFGKHHAGTKKDAPFINQRPARGARPRSEFSVPYDGQPFFVSEFGGIWWNPDVGEGEDSWGYGDRPKNIEEFYERFEGLCKVLLEDSSMFGYCYTQLTDVFQEQNGLYRFDRTSKFDTGRLHKIQTMRAAIEESDLDSGAKR
jgi:beta-galactosidase/beta-glucuronidase